MQPAAQNALLKTLEEPAGDHVFFLTSETRFGVLPTVRSRCVWVAVPPLAIDEAERALIGHGIPSNQAGDIARASRGAVGYGLRYNDEVAPIANRVNAALGGVRSFGDAPAAVRSLSAIHDEPKDPAGRAYRAGLILGTMESDLRISLDNVDDSPLIRIGGERYPAGAHMGLVERIAQASARSRLRMLASLEEARRRLSMYMSFSGVMDALLYSWLEEIYNAAGGRDQVS
jgi:hypothetical protein